jgi:serine/threonine-protein kinase
MRQLFHGALARPAGDRDAYLKEACGGDSTLLAEINRLFKANVEAGSFLESPVVERPSSDDSSHFDQHTMALAPGARLGAYEVVSLIGVGGMGEVYRACDVRLDRPVAIKILRPGIIAGDLERKRRFIHEAKAASALNHPNIVTIHDIGETDGTDFIVMEYVDGKTLGELIGRKGLPVEEAMRCAVQIADALGKAHGAGIVHRDIKPSNVMITHAGLAKVLDFGLAKPFAADLSDVVGSQAPTLAIETTREGVLVGTAAYMSPEQARCDRVGPASDVFSLGSLLYEMITGRRAFVRDTTVATVAAVLRDEPIPIHEITADVPLDLEKFVGRCLRKDPTRRFYHMMDVKLRLEEILADSQSAVARPVRPVAASGRADAPVSVAVLPFTDLSQQRDQEYFCDGLAEELISALSNVEGLRVASHTSSFRFRGQAGDIREIAIRLGVTHVLEGSVRRAGDRLRVTAQLISAADGYHLWSHRYDRELKDIFAVQDGISQAVVSALQEKLGRTAGHLVTRATENPEAYDLYLKGRYHWNRWRADAMAPSAELFERAIAKDPNYAAAWAGLADAHALLCHWTMGPRDAWEKAKRAALKALELDPELPEGHSALGMILSFYEWDWQGAERALRRSIELDPASAVARTWYGTCLLAVGSLGEARAQFQQAVALDPLAINTNGGLATAYYYLREYERAIGQLEKTLDLDPAHAQMYLYLGRSYLGARRLDEAAKVLERGTGLPAADIRMRGILGYAYAIRGKHADAHRLLAEIDGASKAGYHPLGLFSAAFVHIGLGQYDRALDGLERLCAERSTLLHWPKCDPLFDPLRSHPRFQDILRRMGLSP